MVIPGTYGVSSPHLRAGRPFFASRENELVRDGEIMTPGSDAPEGGAGYKGSEGSRQHSRGRASLWGCETRFHRLSRRTCALPIVRRSTGRYGTCSPPVGAIAADRDGWDGRGGSAPSGGWRPPVPRRRSTAMNQPPTPRNRPGWHLERGRNRPRNQEGNSDRGSAGARQARRCTSAGPRSPAG
jgi:hypothetical protein